MEKAHEQHMAVALFSGTGGTERVARRLTGLLTADGHHVQAIPLRTGEPTACEPHDRLVVLFAVHAMNAPEPVYEWLDALPQASGTPAAVLSVSGGGEVSPNTACRMGCIRRLERKGYRVDYDDMLIMPSNWIVATREPLARMLLDVMPQRLARITGDWGAGIEKRRSPGFFDRILSRFGLLEQHMAHHFGRRIRVTDACTGCGRCMAVCPHGNIRMAEKRPVFADRCLMCLGCLYACPAKALRPGIIKWVVIPGGYDLAALERLGPPHEPVDVLSLTQGWAWSGIRKYLLEEDA